MFAYAMYSVNWNLLMWNVSMVIRGLRVYLCPPISMDGTRVSWVRYESGITGMSIPDFTHADMKFLGYNVSVI